MSIGEMTKNVMLIKLTLIILSFVAFLPGNNLLWVILGALLFGFACWLNYQGGVAAGHESASISAEIKAMVERGDSDKVDPKLTKKAWSIENGVKTILASSLFDYVVNCVYIILMMLNVGEIPVFVSRVISWLVVLPYWPVLVFFHPTYNLLTWDIVALLMLSPFLMGCAQFIGYRRGPKLWEKTEEAMRQGRRRAKARSRIVHKKQQPRQQKPLV